MKLISTIAAAAFLASAVSLSAEQMRQDSNGAWYQVSENANGLVFKADNGSTLYLGKDCDAFHTVFGAGRWDWGNAGFGANLGDYSIGFLRNDVPGNRDYSRCHNLN